MDTLTTRLKALSSAEDFLRFFGVPFAEPVVQVNRLHILKRFYRYLHTTDGLAGLDDVEMFRRYRELLANSHHDFVTSTPAREKVFKVLQTAAGQQHVQLSSVRARLAERRAAPRSASAA